MSDPRVAWDRVDDPYVRLDDLTAAQADRLLPETNEYLRGLGRVGYVDGVQVWTWLPRPCRDVGDECIMEVGRNHCVVCGPPEPVEQMRRLNKATMLNIPEERVKAAFEAGYASVAGKRRRLFPDRHPRLHRLLWRRSATYRERQIAHLDAIYDARLQTAPTAGANVHSTQP